MAAKGWQDAKGGRRGVDEARGNRGRGRMVEEEEEVEEEERGVSGQPGSSRATRRNPLSHPPSYPPSLSSRRPCQPPVLLLLLILFLFHVLSKPLPTSTTFASFPTRGGWRWSPIRPTFHAHTPRCVPILLLHASVDCPRLIARFHPSSSFSVVVSADLFRADRSNKSLSYWFTPRNQVRGFDRGLHSGGTFGGRDVRWEGISVRRCWENKPRDL